MYRKLQDKMSAIRNVRRKNAHMFELAKILGYKVDILYMAQVVRIYTPDKYYLYKWRITNTSKLKKYILYIQDSGNFNPSER